ncbi:hypothetical protein BDZ91DRAFT_517191 [Kalaharituber pfeilii]|nr:hypothetical protein BDZ91DRAFT_517191 [Kalaharituber pfeilii]
MRIIDSGTESVLYVYRAKHNFVGRAGHAHILAHKGGRIDSTGKDQSGGTVPHIGQLFFNQILISQVERLAPYNTNRMQLLPNNQDWTFMQQNSAAEALGSGAAELLIVSDYRRSQRESRHRAGQPMRSGGPGNAE